MKAVILDVEKAEPRLISASADPRADSWSIAASCRARACRLLVNPRQVQSIPARQGR